MQRKKRGYLCGLCASAENKDVHKANLAQDVIVIEAASCCLERTPGTTGGKGGGWVQQKLEDF